MAHWTDDPWIRRTRRECWLIVAWWINLFPFEYGCAGLGRLCHMEHEG